MQTHRLWIHTQTGHVGGCYMYVTGALLLCGAWCLMIHVGCTEVQILPYMAVFRTTALVRFIFRCYHYIYVTCTLLPLYALLIWLIQWFNRTIDRLEAKQLVMGLVNHGNSEVRMQALLAIQKMMVQNWWETWYMYLCILELSVFVIWFQGVSG